MLDSFIKALKKIPGNEEVENLYRGNSKRSILRRENLYIYLHLMLKLQPQVMLVGEAPGYKGCKRTGVPFSSEELLMQEGKHPVFGMAHKYHCLPAQNKLEKENSASMVWGELNTYTHTPLIWNIFPYHPHRKGEFYSNRAPRVGELQMGRKFVLDLCEIFGITRIAAVGRKAYQGLTKPLPPQHLEIRYIRHPSYGGKADFVRGLAEFMEPWSQ